MKNLFLLTRYKHLVNMPVQNILVIEATAGCSRFVTSTGNYLLKATLTDLEAQMPAEQFCRVHRSYIVNIPRINQISDDIIHIEGIHVPIAKQYAKQFFDRMKIIR